MDNIYKAVQLTIDSQNLALSKTPTHVYIANQYVDTNDTPLITAPFIIQKALENGTGVVDIVSSTIGSIYEVRLLCDAEVLISGYFYMPPMNAKFSELELYTSYPPRTPPVVNEFWQKTENFILEKTNTLLNFVQVFNAVSGLRLNIGYLDDLKTLKTSSLVGAINEIAVINDKAAIFYNTVADMVAAIDLVEGRAVITHGYYTPNDGGGARYLIKDTATDYSIPVANNLHAVLSDSFDIRKFGIRDNATLDQTTEIKRMCAYADKFVYEIDFLNFSLQVPKFWTPIKTWHRASYPNGAVIDGTDFMGMAFTQAHKLKNLNIAHDKTVRLENCHCMIIFAPMNNPDFEQWFELENIEFDAWNPNYQPITENYLMNGDGARHGFYMMPHANGTVIADGETPTNYSVRYKNINFRTPAYSYNLHTQIHCKNQEFENLTGDYLALYVLQFAHNFYGRNLIATYRDDLHENNRLLVTNAIHYEAELAGKTVTHNLTDIKNIKCYRKSTGQPWASYVFHSLSDKITMNKFVLDNLVGHSRIFNTNVIDCEYKNSKDESSFILLNCPSVKKLAIDNWISSGNEGSFGTTPCLLKSAQIDYLEINNSDLQFTLHFNGVYLCNVKKMVVNKTVINNSDGLGSGSDLTIENLEVDGLTITENFSTITRSNLKKAVLKNVILQGTTDLGVLLWNPATTTAMVDIINMISKRKNAQYDFAFVGKIDANIVNSSTFEILKADSNASRKFVNSLVQQTYVYDFASLDTAKQQSIQLTLDGAKVGDSVSVAFDKPLQGTRMWAEVTSDDTVTVYHRNDTGATVDLPSGTLTVKIV